MRILLGMLALTLLLLIPSLTVAKEPVHVFVLAGQSNMEGQAVVDLDHPKYYNGGKGTLKHLLGDRKKAKQFQHPRDGKGAWVERDDVFVRLRIRGGSKNKKLSIGFAGYPGRHHFGPELQFGHILGDRIQAPILLIKTAWGGKSLHKDFRPPSAGGTTGEYYKRMLSEVQEAIRNIPKDFPALANRKIKMAGFVWFQGWNDAFSDQGRKEYSANLVHLIQDIRRDLKVPKLPVVIGELGNGGDKASPRIISIRKAQAKAAAHPEFKGNVAFAKTTNFARPAKESPNVGHGHHWFGNAESYFLIGDALGRKMLELLN